jgi:hypothetical protein
MIYTPSTAIFSTLGLPLGAILADSSDAIAGTFFLFCCCFYIAFIALILGSYWKIFEKAGQPGWQGIVPILNGAVLAHIAGLEWWWGIIPIVNIYPLFKLAHAFGKSDGYGIGLVLLAPIFLPMLAFGNAQYQLPQRPPLI